MRLLRKSEVLKEKASERKAEIDVGLAIAKRIDNLRDMNSKEESILSKWRTETAKIVQKDVDALIIKKEALEYEVGVLERQMNDLNRPFDEEWELVKMKRLSDLDTKLEDVETREKELVKGEHLYSFRENELKQIEERVRDEAKRSEDMLIKATLEKQESHDIIVQAKLDEARINSEIDARTNEYRKKEAEWIIKEKDLSMREEALRRSVKELVRREKFINDKYKTLERTEKLLQAKK